MVAVKKRIALILLLAAGLAGAVGYAVYRSSITSPEKSWAESLPPDAVASPEMVELRGQGPHPDGRPAAGASLHVVCLHDSPLNNGPALTVTQEDGTFVCPVPKGELARHLVVERPVQLVASADGFGMAWRPAFEFLPEAERKGRSRGDATLRLTKDDSPLTGRIEDAG
jgi:hypothetical protein